MNIEDLRGGLIVSVQAGDDSVLNAPETIATLAACAEANGAVGVRIEGIARIASVRDRVRIPIIGIVKRRDAVDGAYITPSLADVEAVLSAGADIVAFDATRRPRRDGATTDAMIAAIHAAGALAMADCAEIEDGRAAAGADILGTTLCGYTPATRGTPLPALPLVIALRGFGRFTIAEGGIGSPEQARSAFEVRADAVVVGTAITNIDVLVAQYVAATPRQGRLSSWSS